MTTPISPLPTPPSPADSPVDFNTKAFALLGALPAFVTEANAQASGVDAAVASAGLEADAAALKAGEALTSADNAAISKTGADSARDAAVIAKNAAEAALDSFDDKYLGAKSVEPTTDNDGGALLTGALYWDTSLPGMRSWNGGAWVTLPAATAAAISNTPSGSIAATTVQAAINELDAEKFGRNNILGTVSQSAGVPTGAVIERGSNASGEYVRFADGTQIAAVVYAASTSMFMLGGFGMKHCAVSIAWPATFVGTVYVSGAGYDSDPNGRGWVVGNASTTTQCSTYYATASQSATLTVTAFVTAVGRWY